jgi:hypothetical protein
MSPLEIAQHNDHPLSLGKRAKGIHDQLARLAGYRATLRVVRKPELVVG